MIENVAKTLYKFYNKFGKAFMNNSVPSGTEFPYITYTLEGQTYFNSGIFQVMIYDKSYSFTKIVEIGDLIKKEIGNGLVLPIEGSGYIYMTQGSPFYQFLNDSEDITLKTLFLNIEYKIYE